MGNYNRKDTYYRKAKKEGYKSRAAYKLIELNDRFKIIRKNNVILDCGAAPGGWSQVALEIVGDSGKVVGIDLDAITGIHNKNFSSIVGDFTDEETLEKVLEIADSYNAVISDIAPHTTGIRDTDHANSLELVGYVFEFAKKTLKAGGSFAFKLFEGPDRDAFIRTLKVNFKDVKIVKPDAIRSGSMELYVVATGFKKDA